MYGGSITTDRRDLESEGITAAYMARCVNDRGVVYERRTVAATTAAAVVGFAVREDQDCIPIEYCIV